MFHATLSRTGLSRTGLSRAGLSSADPSRAGLPPASFPPPALLHVGDPAPDFTFTGTEGPRTLRDFAGDHWVVLFPDAGAETLEGAADRRRIEGLLPTFRARMVRLLGLGQAAGPDLEAHPFPVAADPDRVIAERYGIADPGARTVFVIDPARRVRLVLTYPPGRPRDFAEVLRFVEALQGAAARERSAAADWRAVQATTLGYW